MDDINQKKVKISYPILLSIGILLNQSNVIFGVNLSIADFFIFFILLFFILKGNLRLPRVGVVFFLALSVLLFFTSFFLNFLHFNYSAQLQSFTRDYIKLFAVFVYFIVGYNLAETLDFLIILKAFAFGAVFMSLFSLVITFVPIPFLHNMLYFGGNRFRGFMNDPNYFAVIQSSALMYFWSNPKISNYWRIAATVLLFFSVLSSGSKTGLILIGALILLKVIKTFFIEQITYTKLIFFLIFLILVIFCLPFFIKVTDNLLLAISKTIPGFGRVSELFTDFEGAISDSGSTRDMAWGNAIRFIKDSPVMGIGIGVYSELAAFLFGARTIAHNTYLQLSVEWGTLFTGLFFCFVFGHLILESNSPSKSLASTMTRNMLLPFMVGSLSLSLNNARLFWILLGGLIYFHYNLSIVASEGNKESVA